MAEKHSSEASTSYANQNQSSNKQTVSHHLAGLGNIRQQRPTVGASGKHHSLHTTVQGNLTCFINSKIDEIEKRDLMVIITGIKSLICIYI